ncbi:tail tube protein [Vibrio phage K469]
MNDLTNFISHIRNKGVSRSNRFRVTIPLPKKVDELANPVDDSSDIMKWVKTGIKVATVLTGGTIEATRGLQVMCSNVQLPGVNIDTADVNDTGHGFKIATGTSKTEIDFGFLLSGDMQEKNTIDIWKEVMINSKTKKVGYYDDYTTDIQIDVLDVQDRVTYSVILTDAYPILFNPVELNKEEADGMLHYQLAFTYKEANTPEKEPFSMLSQLAKLTPVAAVTDVMNGDITGAASKVRDMHKQIQAGTFKTALGVQTYGMCGNVLDQSVGVGAKDMEGIVGGLVSSVQGTPNLDKQDSDTIIGGLKGIL